MPAPTGDAAGGGVPWFATYRNVPPGSSASAVGPKSPGPTEAKGEPGAAVKTPVAGVIVNAATLPALLSNGLATNTRLPTFLQLTPTVVTLAVVTVPEPPVTVQNCAGIVG